MSFFSKAEEVLISYAHTVPLEAFTFFGSLIEEIIAPIPSPIVMTVSGSLAAFQEKPLIYLLLLAVTGALGKVIGAWVLYTISDKAEDIVLNKFGKFLGVSHKEIEHIGSKLSNNWKDCVVLAIIRALPFVPSTVVSVGCGILRIDMKVFLPSTFIGTIVRDTVYLYFGYIGLSTFGSLLSGLNTLESVIQLVAILAVACVIGVIFLAKRNSKFAKLAHKFFKKS